MLQLRSSLFLQRALSFEVEVGSAGYILLSIFRLVFLLRICKDQWHDVWPPLSAHWPCCLCPLGCPALAATPWCAWPGPSPLKLALVPSAQSSSEAGGALQHGGQQSLLRRVSDSKEVRSEEWSKCQRRPGPEPWAVSSNNPPLPFTIGQTISMPPYSVLYHRPQSPHHPPIVTSCLHVSGS